MEIGVNTKIKENLYSILFSTVQTFNYASHAGFNKMAILLHVTNESNITGFKTKQKENFLSLV